MAERAPLAMLSHVKVDTLHPERFREALEDDDWGRFAELIERGATAFAGRVIWNVNSTATGGGVAELLRSLLAYARGGGVDARWVVIKAGEDFFQVTKRFHNNLHGDPGDGGDLGDRERDIYERALEPNARELVDIVYPQDVVILHDPQTAGMIPALKAEGVPVIWRCHVGLDLPNDLARRTWRLLLPYVQQADAYVFSRQAFAWEGLDESKIVVIPPSIDAFSPKNLELPYDQMQSILDAAGIVRDGGPVFATFTRHDGSPGRVDHAAHMVEDVGLTWDEQVVLQVSRWDKLKDPIGVIRGFADHVAPHSDAHLVYAGPAVAAVADDPEGVLVLGEAHEAWHSLAPDVRAKVHLASLPMEDREENAAIVNALQRHASVVVQKSLAEGFGLTVAEAMWKGRPVVATRIGGIQDQIEDGVSGVLLDEPSNLAAYGEAVLSLLRDPDGARRMGTEAQNRVRHDFLGARSLLQYFDLISRVMTPRA